MERTISTLVAEGIFSGDAYYPGLDPTSNVKVLGSLA
jgi:hypothetical protein